MSLSVHLLISQIRIQEENAKTMSFHPEEAIYLLVGADLEGDFAWLALFLMWYLYCSKSLLFKYHYHSLDLAVCKL